MTLSPPLPADFAEALRWLYLESPAGQGTLRVVVGHARAQGWTLRAMGQVLGVSKERIRQIAPHPLHADPAKMPFSVPLAPVPEPKLRPEPTRPKVAACGTIGGYGRHLRNRDPICTPCRQANTDWQRDHRHSRNPAEAPVHGKASTYGNWKCRCEPCKAAHSEKMAERYREKVRNGA